MCNRDDYDTSDEYYLVIDDAFMPLYGATSEDLIEEHEGPLRKFARLFSNKVAVCVESISSRFRRTRIPDYIQPMNTNADGISMSSCDEDSGILQNVLRHDRDNISSARRACFLYEENPEVITYLKASSRRESTSSESSSSEHEYISAVGGLRRARGGVVTTSADVHRVADARSTEELHQR